MNAQRPLRIALISPKGPLYRHKGGIFGKGLRYKPLTLPTLAALIPESIDHRLECYDEGIQDVPLDIQADIIGMTVITGTASRSYKLAAHFRKRGITVVLGGPHISLIPDEAEKHADSIVVGYAEEEWPRLLHDYIKGTLQKRYTQDPNMNLENSPIPKRDVLPRKKYLTEAVFEATRSCIHKCEFCVVPSAWGNTLLQKPIEHIVQDIRQMKARRAIFIDLNIIADKKYARRLFEALIPLKIKWFGLSTTLLCKDHDLLELCARSGCRGLLMGLESINSDSLSSMHKAFNNPDEFSKTVDILHKHNISLQGCFVFGNDADQSDIFMKTARFAVDIGIDLPRFAISTPFPGTPLFKRLDQADRILHTNWEQYDCQHVVFQPQNMSPEELQSGTEAAWKFTYSRSSIWKRLKKTAAPLPIALISNWAYRRYAHNLHKFYTCDVLSWDAPKGYVLGKKNRKVS